MAAAGILKIHISSATMQTLEYSAQIVGFNPNSSTNLGLSALPSVAAGSNGGVPLLTSTTGLPKLDSWGWVVADVGGYAQFPSPISGTFGAANTVQLGPNFAFPNATLGTSNYTGGNVTVGGYATGQDPPTLLFATPRWQRVEAVEIGNYTRSPSTGIITFTRQDGTTFTATISVDGTGKITGRVVSP